MGCIAPGEEHVGQLIDFALDWGGQGPMVVHCWAGISRSTAAAYTALCAINPEVPEELIALRLREASPTAYPNRLIIRLADDALGRRGRMVRAIEAHRPRRHGHGGGSLLAARRPFGCGVMGSDPPGLTPSPHHLLACQSRQASS